MDQRRARRCRDAASLYPITLSQVSHEPSRLWRRFYRGPGPSVVALARQDASFEEAPEEAVAGIGGLGGATVWRIPRTGVVEVRLFGYQVYTQNVVFNKAGELIVVNAKLEMGE